MNCEKGHLLFVGLRMKVEFQLFVLRRGRVTVPQTKRRHPNRKTQGVDVDSRLVLEYSKVRSCWVVSGRTSGLGVFDTLCYLLITTKFGDV